MARRGARARRLQAPGRARSRATGAGPRGDAGLLGLQRAAGNHALQGLLDAGDPGIAHALRPVPAEVEGVVGAGGGRPLEPGLRAELEALVGQDVGRVRVHDDAAAARSAEAADAYAYTAGNHVVFGPGRYAPQTSEGRALVAHEVGHVVASARQGDAGTGAVLRAPKRLASVKDRATLLSGVAPPSVQKLGANTVATIYFAHDTFLIERGGYAVVEKLGEQLSYMAKPMVSVDGYASTEGPEGRNEMLGRMRREAVIAILASKARDVSFGGGGHGASDPAVPETARDPREVEAQRAQNRRVTIVITDLSTPGAPPTPPTPDGDKRDTGIHWTPHEETPEEALQRRLEEAIKHPIDLTPPTHSFSEQFWKVVDEKLDSTMSKLGVPEKYRGTIKDAAHSAIEKGAEKALDGALDAAPLSSTEKEAIKAAVKQAAQTKL